MMTPDDQGDANCEEAVRRLYHYLDGELDEARRYVVKRHLEGCYPCLEAFDFETALRQVIARRCRDNAPNELRVRITLAIQHELRSGEPGGGGMPPF